MQKWRYLPVLGELWGGAALVSLILRNGAGISAVNNFGLIALQGAALRGYVTSSDLDIA